MPIYEYRCPECGKKSEFITFRISEPVPEVCKHCSSESIQRIPSRVRVRLSEETRMERLADPSCLEALEGNDPKSMARFMKTMSREMGDKLGEDVDVDALVEEAMAAEGAGAGLMESGCGNDGDL